MDDIDIKEIEEKIVNCEDKKGDFLYINEAELGYTVHDFIFSLFTKFRADKHKQIDFFMSPQYVKVFSEVLSKLVENYEEKFGTIITNKK